MEEMHTVLFPALLRFDLCMVSVL